MWIPESANDHGSLDGLADDDHTQYLTTGRHAAVDHAGSDTDALHIDEAGEIAAIAEKETPVPGDLIVIEDSEAENAKKKVQIGNLPGGSGGGDTDAIRGSSQIDDLETSVQVFHGAPQTPQPGEIQIQPRNVDHDVERFAVSAESSTHFTVEVAPAPGVGNSFEFGWIYLPATQVRPEPPQGGPPVSGLILWLEGYALELDDGDPIATWEDLSGQGNDATQPTPANQPTFKTNVINGLPVARFSAGHRLLLPDLYSGASEGEVFVVLELPSTSDRGFWTFGTASQSDHYPHSGSLYNGFGSTSRHGGFNPGVTITDPHIFNVSAGPGSWIARTNGNQVRSDGNTVAFPSQPVIGRSAGGSPQNFDGDIAAILCYDHVLSSGDRDDALTYLADRFGISV